MAIDPRQINKTFSIMGSSFIQGASGLIDRLTNKSGTMLQLKREPNNPADKNAIAIFWGAYKLGWVPRGLAAEVAPIMDAGVQVICRKAFGVAGFKGAVRGTIELAYVPPLPESQQEEVPDDTENEPSAGATGEP